MDINLKGKNVFIGESSRGIGTNLVVDGGRAKSH